MSWTLDNAEERAAKNSDTFEIPSREEREALVPGDYAKLVFIEADPPAGERMWVHVLDVLGGDSASRAYEGELNSLPVTLQALGRSVIVDFRPEHIIEIQRGDTLAAVFAREARDKSF